MTSFPATNLITTAIFVLCLITMAVGAVIAVGTVRLIRSVCGLALSCIGLAGLYYFLGSPFLALMEILIYVGAVCVTIVFAVMLAEPEEPARSEKSGSTLAWGGLATIICAAFFCGLVWLGFKASWAPATDLLTDGSIAAIGRSLLTTYSMAFELISLALLVAILGALAIARAGRTRPEPAAPDEMVPGKSRLQPVFAQKDEDIFHQEPSKNGAVRPSVELTR
jgi:NADH:ubiquinone oxidoreductase subunit 6 (subunit J)